MKETKFTGIYEQWSKQRKMLFTESYDKQTFFDDKLYDGKYRFFEPKRSKLAASIMKNINEINLKKGDVVLYLGAAHGYTPSFVSDIIGEKGSVFCVDHAPRVVRQLYFICEKRQNMIPILADASKPREYANRMPKLVDYVYQDIAQKTQVEIFLKNVDMFLKPKGYCFLAVKSRSYDVTQKPRQVYKMVEDELKKYMKIIDKVELDPFEKDHCAFICQKK